MKRDGRPKDVLVPFLVLRALVLLLAGVFAVYHVAWTGETMSRGLAEWMEVALVSLAFPTLVWGVITKAEKIARREAHGRQALQEALGEVEAQRAENARLLAMAQYQEQKASAFMSSVQGIFYEADAESLTPISVRGASQEMLGYPGHELVGSEGLWMHIHPEDIERVFSYCQAEARAGRKHEAEFRMRTADGRTFWVADHASPVERDGKRSLVGILVDVTERHDAAEAARRRAFELETIQNAASILSAMGPVTQRFARLADYLRVWANMDEVIIRQMDKASGEFGRLLAQSRTEKVELATREAPPATRMPFKDVIAFRKSIATNDLSQSVYADSPPAQRGVRSNVAIPLFIDGEIIAVVTFGSAEPGRFPSDTVADLELVATSIAQYIYNLQLQDQLRANLEVQAAQLQALHKAEETARLRAVELEQLQEAIGILNASLPGVDRFAQLAQFLLRLSSTDSVTVRQVNPENGAIGPVLATAISGALTESPVWPSRSERSPLMAALEEQKTIVNNDLLSSPYRASVLVERGLRSNMNMPLVVDGKLIGGLSFGSTQAENFTPELVGLLEIIGSNLAPYIRNAQLQDELRASLQAQTRQLEALDTAVGSLSILDVPDSLKALCEVARTVLDARYAALGIWDQGGNAIALHAAGLTSELRAGMGALEVQSGGLLAALLHQGRPFRVKNIQEHSTFKGFPPGYPDVAVMGVPVETRGAVRAALLVADKVGADEFTTTDELVLRVFASYARVHLHNVRLFEQAEEERSTLASILAGMTDGLIVVGENRRILTINDATLRLLGLTHEEVVGQDGREIVRLVAPRVAEPYHGEQALSALYRGLLERAQGESVSTEMVVTDPERRVLAVTAFPIQVSPGRAYTGILLHDLTTERQALSRRDEFISIASHELRTPLTVQLGFVELLLTRQVDDKTRKYWLTLVHKESLRLAAIVDDLLNVSRIGSGRLQLDLTRVDINAILAEEAAAAQHLSSIHTISTALASDGPRIIADEGKVRQVLANLLSNAVKYSPKGGPVTIFVGHDAAAGEVIVRVKDQGLGIAPEDIKTLFTSFRRLDRPETIGIRGTGLGLYIVSSLMQMMHGRVWVESEMDKGSTFFLAFPVALEDHSTHSAL